MRQVEQANEVVCPRTFWIERRGAVKFADCVVHHAGILVRAPDHDVQAGAVSRSVGQLLEDDLCFGLVALVQVRGGECVRHNYVALHLKRSVERLGRLTPGFFVHVQLALHIPCVGVSWIGFEHRTNLG